MRKTLYLSSALAAVCFMAAEKPGAGKAKPADPPPETPTDLEKAIQNIAPNSDPQDNPNVGRTDLAPQEGQAHSADQREDLAALESAKEDDGSAVAIAEKHKDPILLIEAAIAAANANDVYRRNGPLQTFLRHYMVDQTAIREHQGRLMQREERREREHTEAKEREAAEAKTRKPAAS